MQNGMGRSFFSSQLENERDTAMYVVESTPMHYKAAAGTYRHYATEFTQEHTNLP